MKIVTPEGLVEEKDFLPPDFPGLKIPDILVLGGPPPAKSRVISTTRGHGPPGAERKVTDWKRSSAEHEWWQEE